jgi:BON domain-containing protein
VNQAGVWRLKLIQASIAVAVISCSLVVGSIDAQADDSAAQNLSAPRPAGLPQTSGAPLTDRDCQLALFAREALLRDQVLGPFNLGVTVHSGTAILWGAVPNVALSRRAEEKVRNVLGVAQVRNDLRIAVDDDETEPSLGMLDSPAAIKEKTKSRDRPIPLVSRSEEASSRASNAPVSPPVMPLIAIPANPQKTVSLFEPSMPQPAVKISSRPSLIETLDQFRRSNERFRSIRLDIQGGVVRLWTNAARSEDVFIFAQRVSRVPGVECVIIDRPR